MYSLETVQQTERQTRALDVSEVKMLIFSLRSTKIDRIGILEGHLMLR